YQITISFSQETQSESLTDQNTGTANAQLTGELNLFETISVTESIEGEYARIICRFDSLTGTIESIADGASASLEIFSEKDHVIIYQDDSLVSEYTPQGGPNRGAADFYEKLLFIGEDIGMLVYPSGEIINITENKNLWNLSRDLLGFPGEGFLEIVFPENRSRWEETFEISTLGGFDLQDSPEPLIIQYRITEGRNNVEFEGELFLRQFNSEANVAELENELNLTLNNYQVSKSGSGSFSTNAGTLERLVYSISQIGDIILKGKNSEEYSIRMRTDFESRITYQLIR
ncbi:MAG: hypothetical protein GWO41_02990, partial [candidate division Zixibacteria bacterium]|nr:hypothetical protein [candidate division Zixibacteria bacterium]NIR66832.1 hypothetical protein [candidate division Zixibacteria bacterium]NIS15211.1 hypothetical protein [candidate division Zixibacteria bacterium]NIS48331.1 hypothetical protein [candidate division Zixibacteria bacterium]NIT51725.1 hypothetical protein [candidate division Zixibacteria bacterium]